LCWATVQLVDKVLIEGEAPSSKHYLFVTGLASAPVAIAGLLVIHFSTSHADLAGIAFSVAAGVAAFVVNAFYFFALDILDASIASATLAVVPALAGVASYLVLGQRIGVTPALGIVIITLGVILMNVRTGGTANGVRRHMAWAALGVSILFLVAEYVIEGYAVEGLSAGTVFYWGRIGMLAATAVFAAVQFRAAREAVVWLVRRRGKVGALSAGNEALDMIAAGSLIAAYATGPVGLASGIAYGNPALVYVATIAINMIRPGTIPSEGDRQYFRRRLVGIIMVAGGVLLASTGR
jgi:uncharacterized membrane protein